MSTDVGRGGPADVERGELEHRIECVSRAMRTHGGGIRLLELGRDGAVRVGFTGLCASCQLRPLTFAHTIEPALASVPGVSRVSADGARISDEALVRIRRYFTDPSYSIE